MNDISHDVIYYLLQGCTKRKDVIAGRQLQSLMVSTGFDAVAILGDHLIRLFALHGSLLEANLVFCKILEPSVFTWHGIISAHTMLGESYRALELYHQMREEDIIPDNYVFPCILKACSTIGALCQGKFIHDEIIRSGFESDKFVGSALIEMYAKCGDLETANDVFDMLPNRSVGSWNTMIVTCAHHGFYPSALGFCKAMDYEGNDPDKATFSCLLKACASLGTLRQGRLIHEQVVKSGYESTLFLERSLIEMYAKFGSLEEAQNVFNSLLDPDVVSWGIVTAGYVQHGHGHLALELFEKMQLEGREPDRYVFSCVLKACASVEAINNHGIVIHDQIIRNGLESDAFVGSALVDMYAKCGMLEAAQNLFYKLHHSNVIFWNVMITRYAEHGCDLSALELFSDLQHEGITPDNVTFLSILKACGSIGALEQGKSLHDQIIRSGVELDMVVGSMLVGMYAKCGRLEEANRVFDILPHQDIVLWGSIIAGYSQQGHGIHALELLLKMQRKGLQPNAHIFSCALKACGTLEAIDKGIFIHDVVVKNGLEADVIITNTLVDMYSKCGSLEEAHKTFNTSRNRDVASWGAMIAGYAQHGKYRLAIQCFEEMQCEGLKPNGTVYVSILVACSHAGKVDEARSYFKAMKDDHGIKPTVEHFSCMVDLLGRAGHLTKAQEFLNAMPVQSDTIGWMSLLTSCRTYSNVKVGKQCFEEIIHLDPTITAAYVLMSTIYADAHMWENVLEIQKLRNSADAWKKPAMARIGVNKEVHDFIVGDKSHLQGDEIHVKLEELSLVVKREGYIPQLSIQM